MHSEQVNTNIIKNKCINGKNMRKIHSPIIYCGL